MLVLFTSLYSWASSAMLFASGSLNIAADQCVSRSEKYSLIGQLIIVQDILSIAIISVRFANITVVYSKREGRSHDFYKLMIVNKVSWQSGMETLLFHSQIQVCDH